MRYCGFLLLIALFLLVGCGGMSDELKQRVQLVPGQIDSIQTELEQQKQKYAALIGKPESAFLKPYVTAEKLPDSFRQAESELQQAQARQASSQALLKQNKSELEDELRVELTQLNKHLTAAKIKAGVPFKRVEFLSRTKANAPNLVKEAQGFASQSAAIKSRISTQVNAKIKRYPQQPELPARLKTVLASHDKINANLTRIKAQYPSSKPDYAVLGDAHLESQNLLAKLQTESATLGKQLAELDTSYVKTLTDMKAQYFTQVGRSSWNNSSDYDNENLYTYEPVEVSEEDFEALDAIDPEADLASYDWGQVSPKIDAALWSRLKVDPQLSWTSSDDSAVFFIADTPMNLFHKYRIEQNGQISETDWVAVSEAEFVAHQNDLGMDISGKPYGTFEDQAVTTATPPGMAYVGNPAYGSWSGSGSGRTWVFLPIYQSYPVYAYGDFLDWDSHYRGKKAYYGRKNPQGLYAYGSSSSYSSQYYARSYYASQGGYGGARVRGAGASRRGGGPGGGGK